MNSINFNKNNFPLTTTVLGFLQSAAAMLEKLTSLVGGNYILSGCVTQGTAVSAGHVVINGEIIPFAGGELQTYVRVVITDTVITVQDSDYTQTTKELVWGAGAGQIAWESFIDAKAIVGSNGFVNQKNLFKLDELTPGIVRWATLLEFQAKSDLVAEIPLVVRPSHLSTKRNNTTPVLPAGWSGSINYFEDNIGNIHVFGVDLWSSGGILSNEELNMFVLPVGYRPAVEIFERIVGLNNQINTVLDHVLHIKTDGVLSIRAYPDPVSGTYGHVNFYKIFRRA
jgi:hypothetical protein